MPCFFVLVGMRFLGMMFENRVHGAVRRVYTVNSIRQIYILYKYLFESNVYPRHEPVGSRYLLFLSSTLILLLLSQFNCYCYYHC